MVGGFDLDTHTNGMNRKTPPKNAGHTRKPSTTNAAETPTQSQGLAHQGYDGGRRVPGRRHDVGLDQSRGAAHGRAIHAPPATQDQREPDRQGPQDHERQDDVEQIPAIHGLSVRRR